MKRRVRQGRQAAGRVTDVTDEARRGHCDTWNADLFCICNHVLLGDKQQAVRVLSLTS